MSELKDIVPPLELCEQIPAGEFEDSVFAWRYPTYDERNHRLLSKWHVIEVNWDAVKEYKKKYDERFFPAPTLEEIIIDIGKTHKHPVLTYCHNHWETTCYTGYTNAKLFCINFEATASEAALRLWFKVKGIEVE